MKKNQLNRNFHPVARGPRATPVGWRCLAPPWWFGTSPHEGSKSFRGPRACTWGSSRVVLISFILALTGNIGIFSLNADVVDRTVAVVNDEAITESELSELLNPISEQLTETYRGDELEFYSAQARKEILERLIEDKLVIQEAKRQKVLVSTDEVEQKISELKSKFSSEEEFEKSLSASSMNIKKLKDRIREQLMMARIFDREVRYRISVNPQEVMDYFKNNPDKFKDPKKVKVRNIISRFSNIGQRLEANKKIKEALALLKNGKDFVEVAKEYSEESDIDKRGEPALVKAGQMKDEIDRVIFNLKKGEISNIIETESAFSIFLVEEKIENREKGIDDARDEIQNILLQQKLKERFNEWIGKLKKDAYISIK